MKLKTIAYAAFIATAAGALVIGSGGTSEAKAKKTAAVAPHPAPCFESSAPVCGVKGGMKFTYANSCYAEKDGAKIVSQRACPTPKAHKKAKKMSKPEKKAEMKKPATPDKKK